MLNQQNSVDTARYPRFLAAASQWHVYANAAPGKLVMYARREPPPRTRAVHVTALLADFMVDVPIAAGREMRTTFAGADDEYDRKRFTLAQCFERAFVATLSYAEFAMLHPGASVEDYDEHRERMSADGSREMALALRAGLGDDLYFLLLSNIAQDVQRAATAHGTM